MAVIVILFAGVSAYRTMSRAEDPGFIIRTAQVTTNWPGASPERVELLITDKLEKSIQEMPEIDFITSTSKTGSSVIYVNILETYKDMRPIWDSLRRKVEKAEPLLPDDANKPVVNDEFGDVFGIIVTIIGEGFSYRELKDVADDVRDELLLIDMAAKVEIYGAQEERIFVEYNNARLSEFGISPVQLRQILQARNIVIPGGDVTTEYEKIVLEPTGNFETVDDLKKTIIEVPGSSNVVYLEDLANIYRSYIDPPNTKMRCGSERCLGLAVSMREGGNIISLGDDVRQTIDRLVSVYPIGIEFGYLQFQPDPVEKKVKDFTSNLGQAIAIVTLVMLIFLGVRTGLIIASLIPMAMLMALMFMGFFEIGLDQISLAALIIALGMLVDNGIVMAESVMVQMSTGKSAIDSAVDSANELKVPLLTSSLTTAAAFLPIFLAESTTGEYTASLFKVVTITLLCSWLISLTVIPMLCVKFLKVDPTQQDDNFDSSLYKKYRNLLTWILKNPSKSLIATAIIFFLSLQGFKLVPKIFFPPNERPTFTLEVKLPIGTPIERTDYVVSEIESELANYLVNEDREDGITNWGVFIGQGAPRFQLSFSPEPPSPDYALFIINTSKREIIDSIIPGIEEFCISNFPDIKPTVRPLELGPPSWPPVEVRLSGKDSDILFSNVDNVKSKLESTNGTKLIDDDWGARSKKLFVKINQARAYRAGVTSEDIATSLQTSLSGMSTTEYREDDKLIPVMLRSVEADRVDIGKLESLNVYVQATGKSLPLKQVADIEVAWQPAVIKRRDRLRTITIESGLESGYTAAEINTTLVPWLKEQSKDWNLGYSWEIGGTDEESGKANASISAKLPIAGMIILLLLVGQFNSIRRPVIILITIPLGIIGVVLGLLVTNLYFGFMTLLGIISLAGIVINNAIVLLDRINIEITQNNLKPERAVIESAQQRLRPILLTTVTTISGLIPLWLFGGLMFEPMAVAIIFGLLFATALTLGLVPVLYSLFFRLDFKNFTY
ncbi:MAG: efflux RND transporter permease subunit [Candidatus Dadabacteria bacterium]|nr:efflux RND transporter permease subunit [Candidatus Dadabacteria bacterium]NIV42168.1 AcrB/AcrD/AcrF family protein [Candidatus Dadabacteria bacterium]NIX16507.1 AcrB/AcrD/AcrF family protein [Candidatus Dadabacteria bacterium]